MGKIVAKHLGKNPSRNGFPAPQLALTPPEEC